MKRKINKEREKKKENILDTIGYLLLLSFG